MNRQTLLHKLEDDLCYFLISEISQGDPTKRTSSEMFKYKGLAINTDPNSKEIEKTVLVRIGALEAEFKIQKAAKCSGGLNPMEERLIMIWLAKISNQEMLLSTFKKVEEDEEELSIIPFDLEELFETDDDEEN